jgi:uncharacterized protein YecT (DUF1311 family)
MLMKFSLVTILLFLSSSVASTAQHMNSSEAPCRTSVVTSDMARCFDQAFKMADRDLNRTYLQIRKKLTGEDLRKVQLSQQMWLKYRDANCSAEQYLYTKGRTAPIVLAACLEEDTRSRTKELKTMYAWLNAK